METIIEAARESRPRADEPIDEKRLTARELREDDEFCAAIEALSSGPSELVPTPEPVPAEAHTDGEASGQEIALEDEAAPPAGSPTASDTAPNVAPPLDTADLPEVTAEEIAAGREKLQERREAEAEAKAEAEEAAREEEEDEFGGRDLRKADLIRPMETALLACLIAYPDRFSRYIPSGQCLFNHYTSIEIFFEFREMLRKGKEPTLIAITDRVVRRYKASHATDRDYDERIAEMLEYAEEVKAIDAHKELEHVLDTIDAWYRPAREQAAMVAYAKGFDSSKEGTERERRERLQKNARLKREVIDAVEQRDASVEPPPLALKDAEDGATLLAANVPLPPELIAGIVHQGLKVCLSSGSKDRKTWLLMYIAVCIAAGADFWGFKTQAGKVLYLNFELPRPFFRQRLAALCDAMGIVLKPGRLHTICMRGRAADGDLICFELRRLFAKAGYVAVIFDPVYKMQGVRNESSLGEMALLFNALEKVATEFNAAIFFANHYAKGIQGGKEPLDRVGGSRAFAADPDVIINLTKHKLHSDNLPLYVVDFTLRCAPPVNHCCVHWEYPLFVIDLEHDADDVKVEPVKKTQAQVREENEAGVLFKILLNSESPLSKTEWMEAAKLAGTDLHRTTFGRRVDALKEAGKIEPSGDGRWQSKID